MQLILFEETIWNNLIWLKRLLDLHNWTFVYSWRSHIIGQTFYISKLNYNLHVILLVLNSMLHISSVTLILGKAIIRENLHFLERFIDWAVHFGTFHKSESVIQWTKIQHLRHLHQNFYEMFQLLNSTLQHPFLNKLIFGKAIIWQNLQQLFDRIHIWLKGLLEQFIPAKVRHSSGITFNIFTIHYYNIYERSDRILFYRCYKLVNIVIIIMRNASVRGLKK